MSEERSRLDRVSRLFDPEPDAFDRLRARRARVQRRRRITAVVAGISIAAIASIPLLTSGLGHDDPGLRTGSPAPRPSISEAPNAGHEISVGGLHIAIPPEYTLLLDVEGYIASLEARDVDPTYIDRFREHPEIFMLYAARPGKASRSIVILRAPYPLDVSAFTDREVLQVLDQGGSILRRSESEIGGVAAETVTSRGEFGNLRTTHLVVLDGSGWTIRMAVESGELIEGASRREEAALRQFSRIIRTVSFS